MSTQIFAAKFLYCVCYAVQVYMSSRPSDGERRNLKKPNRQARDFSVRSLHSLSRNDNGGGKAACACFAGRAKENGLACLSH